MMEIEEGSSGREVADSRQAEGCARAGEDVVVGGGGDGQVCQLPTVAEINVGKMRAHLEDEGGTGIINTTTGREVDGMEVVGGEGDDGGGGDGLL